MAAEPDTRIKVVNGKNVILPGNPLRAGNFIELNETAVLPTGSWYGSGGWLPSKEIMDEWRTKTITDAYVDLEKSTFSTFSEMANHTTHIFVKSLNENKDDAESSLAKNIKFTAVDDPTDKSDKLNKNKLQLSPVGYLDYLMTNNDIIRKLVLDMIAQSTQIPDPLITRKPTEGLIKHPNDITGALTKILSEGGPPYYKGHVVGVPIAALFTNVNATLAGQTLFRISQWNDAIMDIVKQWGTILDSKQSWSLNTPWLSKDAQMGVEISKNPIVIQPGWNINIKGEPVEGPKDSIWIWPNNGVSPYWNTWNEFFARDVKKEARPVAGKTENGKDSTYDHTMITSCNDGQEFRWRENILRSTTFWLKTMPYSLVDILGGLKDVNAIKYSKIFEGGKIFQTFLNPNNYHQWWSPVTGKIVYKTVIPGLLASKLQLLDIDGATTASCPYLLNVNSRGLLIIDTTGYANIGLVCAVPIGMVDVSSIVFNENIQVGTVINKGDNVGRFKFGGSSSFAILFENVKKYNKDIIFIADHIVNPNQPNPYNFPMDPPAQAGFDGGGILVNVGSQIAKVIDINFKD